MDATIQIVGDITLAEIKNKLKAKLHEWKGSKPPAIDIPVPVNSSKKTLYFMHRPEVEQSVILAGYTIAPYGAISEIAKEPLINILGGDFTSRINLNLREDKHWTYGAGAFIKESIGSRPFVTYTQVQIDKTKESIEEIIKEFNWIRGEKPITPEEFEKTKNNQVMALPGIWETNAAVSGSLSQLIKYRLPSDYWVQYSNKVKALTLEEVQELGGQLIEPAKLQWFIVSNKDVVLDSLKSLSFEEILQVDGDGNVIERIV